MDACRNEQGAYFPAAESIASELDAWFAVSGDMDDFIYFGDEQKSHSEK